MYCAACHVEAPGVDYRALSGWYRLQLKGDERPGAADVRPGYYCGATCLAAATMTALGCDPGEVRAWLADVTGVAR